MKNKQLYRAAFSHLRSSSEVRWENYQNQAAHSAPEARESVPRLRPVLSRLTTAAAVAALLVMVCGIAVATNLFGLGDQLFPSGPRISAHEGGAVDMSSFFDAPEYQAQSEWNAFCIEYDPDRAILRHLLITGPEVCNAFYRVYSSEMSDKLEEIAAKYGLKLHTARADLTEHPELVPTFWTEDVDIVPGRIFEDGSFSAQGQASLAGSDPVGFLFYRSVRGTLDMDLMLLSPSLFTTWNYSAACGVEVILGLGENQSFLVADLGDSVVSVLTLIGESLSVTPAWLEGLADRLDLAALTPAVSPALSAEMCIPALSPSEAIVEQAYYIALGDWLNSGVMSMGDVPPMSSKQFITRAAYAAELQSWLDSGGAGAEAPDQFAVYDVDGDGAEELVMLFTSGITASYQGQVLSYDPNAPDSWTVELNETPFLTFYTGGVVMAMASHNQTKGELWPYTLYRFDPAKRVYVELASVYSVSLPILEQVGMAADYPAEADGAGAGIVYYVTPAADGAEEQVMDSAQYEAWLAEIMGGSAEPMELPYLSLTEENIASILP